MVRPKLTVNRFGAATKLSRKAAKKASREASADPTKKLRDYDASRTRPKESKPPTT
jgi:hypothetical protein